MLVDYEKYDVFISYSRKDKAIVDEIRQLLDANSITYWLDTEKIRTGSEFMGDIVGAIEKSDLVLFISSVNSNASHNVAKEISIADKFKKTILPVRIDDAPYSSVIEYDLIGVDYIDYSIRSNESLEKLRKSILARLLISDTLAAL
ncbi:MAG: toll/interleukin-1 receptor domain-containing protein [Bacteroidales bacterium]|nr:toll/interleukin-1 receptor domain-containing protein [Bacteroidales bacterium]